MDRYPIIHGVVGESPYGAFITLIDSFKIGQQFNMVGATSEKIRCHLAVVGNFHMPESPVHFEHLILGYSYLKDWVGNGGIKFEHAPSADGLTFVITYVKPRNVEFPFGDKTLTLGFEVKTPQKSHHASIVEDAAIVIEPVGDITAETLSQDQVRTIQDLISFATDTPNAVEDIKFQGEKDERGVAPKLHLIYDPIFSLGEKKKSLHPIDMLFTYADCQDQGINIFQRWLDFSRKHRAFCEVYFGYTYSIPRYADDRLVKAVSAFTLLSSNLVPRTDRTMDFLAEIESAMRARYSEEEQAYLKPLMPTGPEVEMPNRLLEFLEDNSDHMGQVIEDLPHFVRSVVDTIDFFERREEGGRTALGGGDLHYAVEKIKMLIKILVLKELGFGQDAVTMFVERNKRLNHLKMV